MRQAMAKASRREIRRAFGTDAVGLVQAQHDGLTKHAHAIELLMTLVFGRGILGRFWWLLTGK